MQVFNFRQRGLSRVGPLQHFDLVSISAESASENGLIRGFSCLE